MSTPTLYDWIGGHEALVNLTQEFYRRIKSKRQQNSPLRSTRRVLNLDRSTDQKPPTRSGRKVCRTFPTKPR